MDTVDVKFSSNSDKIINQMDANVARALFAMGQRATTKVINRMEKGYFPTRKAHIQGNPLRPEIRDTGDLMRDVNYDVSLQNSTVSIGNSLEYATQVHEGNRKIKARPYLKDGIMENIDDIRAVGEMVLGEGLK